MCSSEFNLQGTNMDYLPSKELLSEVLGHKIWKVMDCNMGTLRYCIYPNKGDEPSEYIFPINIYELAHKCKEWAFNNGYYLNIYNDAIDVVLKKSCKIVENITDGSFKYSPMLVFKACQWILDNKENK